MENVTAFHLIGISKNFQMLPSQFSISSLNWEMVVAASGENIFSLKI